MNNVLVVTSSQAWVTGDVFQKIAKAINGSEHLVELDPDFAQRSYEDRLAIIAFDKATVVSRGFILTGEPVGFARLARLTAHTSIGQWAELGSVWVREDFRASDLEVELSRRLIVRCEEQMNILATTTSVTTSTVCTQLWLRPVLRSQLPRVVQESSCAACPRSLTGATQRYNADCKRARGEPQQESDRPTCHWYVTHQTAERHDLPPAA